MGSFSIWKFLAGTGFFLFGLQLLDRVLSKLAGRSFKKFLRKYTGSLGKAIISGTLLTALLQSSSIVQLVTLGFVESAIIPFQNALGIIMGSNLGSTMISWIIATLGFKMDIEALALPGLAVSTIGMFFFYYRKNIYNSFRLILAVSAMFFGLGMMKESAGAMVANLDMSRYAAYPNIVFILIGFAVTSLVQASSVTVAITLTALNVHAISFPAAASVVIGSEVGTAMKTLVAGWKGSGNKKRAAYANFYFNVVTMVISFALLPFLLEVVIAVTGMENELVGLAFFQSLINLIPILVFLPFMKKLSRWLEKSFIDSDHAESYISESLPPFPELASDAVEEASLNLIRKTVDFHNMVLDIAEAPEEGFMKQVKSFTRMSGTTMKEYNRLKKTEGDLLNYVLRLQAEDMEAGDYNTITRCMECLRNTIHSAKSVKDINHNVNELRKSAKDSLHDFYYGLQRDWIHFRDQFLEAMEITDLRTLTGRLESLMNEAFNHQQENYETIKRQLAGQALEEVEASTLLNIEREMLSSKKSLVRALAYLRLSTTEARDFEYQPD